MPQANLTALLLGLGGAAADAFNFTGTLESVTINITEQELTEEQIRTYREGRAAAAFAQ